MVSENLKRLPNRITMFRIFLIILFIPTLLFNDILSGSLGSLAKSLQTRASFLIMFTSYAALVIFILASISDFFDGFIARKYNIESNFGRVMDPLADKIMVISALIGFVQLRIVPAWMVIIVIGREFLISGIRIMAAQSGRIIAASNWGKAKTVIEIITILAILLLICVKNTITDLTGQPWQEILIKSGEMGSALFEIMYYTPYWLMFIATSVSLISGLEYYFKNSSIFEKEI